MANSLWWDHMLHAISHKLTFPSETTRRPPVDTLIHAYFQGALHDGTYNQYNQRFRISQDGTEWLTILQHLLRYVGFSSWIYREGKSRNVYVLETRAPFLDMTFDPLVLKTPDERAAYIRGFFDAEGGMPRKRESRFYVQLVQKNHSKLRKIKKLLHELGVDTGTIHNPSKKVDPEYWRMFVLARSYRTFSESIGSWHPRRLRILRERWMVI